MSIDKIVSLCKRRGFIFQSSDIYGGFRAVYDYGPLGIALKNNISQLWWKSMTQLHENIVGLDSAILMDPKYGKLRVTLEHSTTHWLTASNVRLATVQMNLVILKMKKLVGMKFNVQNAAPKAA